MAKELNKRKRTTEDEAVGSFELSQSVSDMEDIKILYFREPTIRDLKLLEKSVTKNKSQTEVDIDMIALLTGVDKDAIETLPASDFTKIKGEFSNFFSKETMEAIEDIKTPLTLKDLNLDIASLESFAKDM